MINGTSWTTRVTGNHVAEIKSFRWSIFPRFPGNDFTNHASFFTEFLPPNFPILSPFGVLLSLEISTFNEQVSLPDASLQITTRKENEGVPIGPKWCYLTSKRSDADRDKPRTRTSRLFRLVSVLVSFDRLQRRHEETYCHERTWVNCLLTFLDDFSAKDHHNSLLPGSPHDSRHFHGSPGFLPSMKSFTIFYNGDMHLGIAIPSQFPGTKKRTNSTESCSQRGICTLISIEFHPFCSFISIRMTRGRLHCFSLSRNNRWIRLIAMTVRYDSTAKFHIVCLVVSRC